MTNCDFNESIQMRERIILLEKRAKADAETMVVLNEYISRLEQRILCYQDETRYLNDVIDKMEKEASK